MSDIVRISAECKDKEGNTSVRSMTIRERDTEVISSDDANLMFLFACRELGLECVGEIKKEYV